MWTLILRHPSPPLPPTFNCHKSNTTFWYQSSLSQWPRGTEQLSYLGTDVLQSNIRIKQTETRRTSWAHTRFCGGEILHREYVVLHLIPWLQDCMKICYEADEERSTQHIQETHKYCLSLSGTILDAFISVEPMRSLNYWAHVTEKLVIQPTSYS